jgi:hypothetical protein
VITRAFSNVVHVGICPGFFEEAWRRKAIKNDRVRGAEDVKALYGDK